MNPMMDASAEFGALMFGWSLVLGAALGVVYTSFSLLAVVSGTRTVGRLVLDVLFFAVSAASVFLFCAARNGGAVRGYVLLGTVMGFGAYYLTLGRLFAKMFGAVERAVRRFFDTVEARCSRWLTQKAEKLRGRKKKYPKTPKKATKKQKTHLPDAEIT